LLILGNVAAKQLLAEILQAVPVGVGAHQTRGRARAIERRADEAEIAHEHGDVEAREMEELQHALVRQHALQVRRVVVGAVELHEMRFAGVV
jgi:diphthamide synthase (EF-2-diphthine--ammonia ligase)